MSQNQPRSLFGEIALAMNMITREQLAECIIAQQRASIPKRLGDVCRELGYLNDAQIQQIVRYQQQMQQQQQARGSAPQQPAQVSRIPLQQVPAAQHPQGAANRAQPSQRAASNHAPTQNAPQNQQNPYAPLPPLPEAPRGAKSPAQGASPQQPQNRPPQSRAPQSSPNQQKPAESSQPRQMPAGQVSQARAAPTRNPSDPSKPARIDAVLRKMVELDASDLHLSTGMPPMLRINGKIGKMAGQSPFSHPALRELLFEIIPDRAYQQFSDCNDADFAYSISGTARFRVNYYMDAKGIAAAFRVIPYEILSPDKLGLPSRVLDLCWLSKGLVLVTGPTGSGKSTTLASLIDAINRKREDHILTIEDPIEFLHENKRCLVNQREVGTHTDSFKSALRAALREDPDIVLVGEMRDLETISIAVETAETGHLVFGTLHTITAPSTIDRIIDQFPVSQQAQVRTMIAGSLKGVISQMLCTKRGGGRVAAYEVLLGTPAVANLIREGKTQQLTSIMQTGRNIGMQTMNDHMLDLVRAGKLEVNEAYAKANDKLGMQQLFANNGIPFRPEWLDQATD